MAITGKRWANLILVPKVAGVPWLTLPCYLFGSCRAVTGTSYLSYLYGLEPRFGWDIRKWKNSRKKTPHRAVPVPAASHIPI
ncbi:unnamed protein product [Fusarium graminearum]|uniref:Chromosome 1, complete genome n=1 Tax=Gibberella zeae (strain ATCC MYA-4620 / CBS 123657 / FGSC 9075 / NRRL 31084 / PH-1) TaxID=229533 RepID=A0A098D2X6_GIBZE|nr:unnamed protein product [Fusarium graminearum]CZS76590.1 unnamed protein product [Fusarium graminearum]